MSPDSCRNCSSAGWWSLSEAPDPASHTAARDVAALAGPAMASLLGDVLARGVPFRFEARGFSMTPFVRDRDVVTVAPLRGRARLGDVVAFAGARGWLVVHRVVARRGSSYEIRADNGRDAVDVVPVGEVLGVVTRIERGGRDVRLGLGPERLLLAGLLRCGLLVPIVRAARAARARLRRGAVL